MSKTCQTSLIHMNLKQIQVSYQRKLHSYLQMDIHLHINIITKYL